MNRGLRRKLDHITDILWVGGVTNPVICIEQISYLIFLKLLDEEEQDRELRARLGASNGNAKLLFPQQAERYRWSKWCFKSGPELRDFIQGEVFPYMASLAKDEPEVAEYFRDAVLEIVDPNVLKQVVDEIDAFEFCKLGLDVKGDIFEYLLTHLGKSSLNGEFRTPRQIRSFMVEMVAPELGDTVFDPACGTAGFLIDTVDYLLTRYSESIQEYPIYGEDWLEKRGQKLAEAKKEIPNLQICKKGAGEKIPDWSLLEASVYGMDVSRQMMRISMMNLILHGIRHARLKRGNVLSEHGGLTEEGLSCRYKVILSNPPFGGQIPKDSIRSALYTSSKRSELLFLGLMMEHLAPGGRCAAVVPEGLLFGSTSAHKDLRKKLIEDFDLLAVVSLPVGVLKPYAVVKTSVLVFRKPSEGVRKTKNRKVWFYEVSSDGYGPDKVSGGGRVETPNQNDIPDMLGQWRVYRDSKFTKPPGAEANSILEPGSDMLRCWWADVKALAANDFNLAVGRYKPQVAAPAPKEDPADLIRDVLVLEKSISDGLEKLLMEVGGKG